MPTNEVDFEDAIFERNGVPAKFDDWALDRFLNPHAPGGISRLEMLQQAFGTDQNGVGKLIDEAISNGVDIGAGDWPSYIEVQSQLSAIRVILDTETVQGDGLYTIVSVVPGV